MLRTFYLLLSHPDNLLPSHIVSSVKNVICPLHTGNFNEDIISCKGIFVN